MAAPKRHLEFKCPECKEAPPELRDATYTFVYIQEHLAREHIDKLALYFCPTCKEGFATPFHVHDHIRKKCKITDIIQTEHYTRNLLIYGQSAIYHLQKQTEQSVIDRVGEEGRRTADEYMRRITAYVEEVSLLKRQLADCAEELSQLKSKFDDSLSEVERLKFLLAAQQQPVPVEGMDFRGLSTTPGSPPPPGVVNRKTQMRLRLSKQAVCRERSPRMHDPRVSSQAVNLGVSSQQTSASDDSVPPVQQAVISESTLSFVEQQILPPPPTLNLEPHSLDRPIKQEPSSPVAYGYSPVPDHFPAEIQRIWNLEGFEEPNFNLKTETLPALPPPRSPSPDKRFQPKIVVDEKPIGMSSPDTAGHTTQPTSERNATAPNSETTARSHWSLADVDPAQIIGHQSASRGHSPDVKKSPIPTSETELQPTNNVTGSRQESARITGVPLAKPTRESGKASAVPSTVPATVKTVVEWQKGSIKKPLHGPVKTTGQQATDIKMETISTATTAEVTKTAPKPIEPKPAAPANVSNHPSKPTEPAVVSGGKPVPKKTPTNTQKTETIKSQCSTLVLARRPELKRFEQPSTSAESSFLKSPSVLVTIDDEDDLVLKDEDSEEEGEIVEVPVPVQQKQARAERKKEEESRKKSWKSKSKGSSAGGTQPAGDSSIRKRRASVVEEASKIKPAKRHKYVRFETEFHVCAYENCCQDLTHGPCAFCYGHHQPENCATFVSFEDRRISCLLTTFCYHCLNFHAIQKRCVHVACRFCGRSNHHTAFCRSKENGQLCSRLHRIGLTKKLPETPHLQTLFNLRVAAKQIVEYDTKDNPHWIKYTEQPPYVQWTLTEQFRDTYLYLLNNNPYQKTCVDVTPGTSNR